MRLNCILMLADSACWRDTSLISKAKSQPRTSTPFVVGASLPSQINSVRTVMVDSFSTGRMYRERFDYEMRAELPQAQTVLGDRYLEDLTE
jgi:hypothetical protein